MRSLTLGECATWVYDMGLRRRWGDGCTILFAYLQCQYYLAFAGDLDHSVALTGSRRDELQSRPYFSRWD